MTNLEFAAGLEKLAARYRADETLPQTGENIFVDEKEELISVLNAFGGKWKKHIPSTDSVYETIRLESVDFAPLTLRIHKDKVCRRTVTWDCEPLLSLLGKAELDIAAQGKED